MKTITIVIPVFNEGTAIDTHFPIIFETLKKIKMVKWHVLVIDDGSTDNTMERLQNMSDKYHFLGFISFNRHFGKEAAIHAGLLQSHENDAVIVMDSDLQHPPQLIPQMIDLWQQGLEVVEAYKVCRGKESHSSRFMAQSFYYLFKLFAGLDLKNHSDFKLLDRKVVEAYCALPEKNHFFRGLIHWMGFSSAQIPFEVPARQQGVKAWSRLKLLKFSLTAIITFSSAPLQIITFLGFFSLVLGLSIGGIALYDKFTGVAVSGFTTVILLILIIGSLLMVALGLLGVYVAQIYEEVKRRPDYLINWKKSRLKKNSF